MKTLLLTHNYLLLFLIFTFNLHPLSALTSQIPLKQGWNLISLGLTPPSGSIEVLFSNLPDLKYVMGFFRSPADEGTEGFRTYMNSDDLKEFSTLKTMDGLHGYWIYMNGAATLEVNGTEIADTREWSLSAGWNLAGYWLPSGNNLPTLETQTGTVIDSVFNLTSIDGVAKYIMGFYRDTNGGMEGFRSFMNNSAISFSNLKSLDPVHGYWYYMDGPGVLEYLAGLPARSLTGITVSPSSITLNPGTNYDLSKITVKAVYSNDSQETAANVTWSRKSGGGTLSGSTYTAPGSEGTAELIASFTSRNITATRELTVTVTAAPLPVHVLTVTLAPVDAVSAGAQWSIDHGTTWRISGDTVGIEENAAYTIECKAVSGWTSPDTVESVMETVTPQQLVLTYVKIVEPLWQQVASAAPFCARLWHTGVTFNGKMWVLGGYNTSWLNDVWHSSDGAAWTQETANASWSARLGHTSLVFNGKLWVIAGADSEYKNDVWSSTDGTDWTRVTEHAGFSARYLHTSLAYHNRMWVIGGCDGSRKNDVWYSTDGAFWLRSTANAPWTARQSLAGVVYDNRMWIFGGDDGIAKNDVWYSVDGADWIRASAGAAWSTRYGQTCVAHNRRICLTGGYDGYGYRGDLWFTEDGTSWIQANSDADFPGRQYYASLIFDNRIWVIGGIDSSHNFHDVWKSIDSAANMPVDLQLAENRKIAAVNQTLNLPGTSEIRYNDGSCEVRSIVWSKCSGGGSLSGNSFTAPTSAGTVELQASYTENGSTIHQLYLVFVQPQFPPAWDQATTSAGWCKRANLTGLVYGGRMWVFGGYDGNNCKNDVWYSTDGVSWTLATAAAGWSARLGHTSLIFNGKMWVIAGVAGGDYKNDVWNSTDGVSWTRVTENAGFSARYLHASLVYDNRMWVIGGCDGSRRNDVWCSTDGATWQRATQSAPWTARQYHACAVFDDQMWLFGGDDMNLKNDVWHSTDGVIWVQAADAPWSGRYGQSCVVYGQGIGLTGGFDGSGFRNDVWFTANGTSWIQETSVADFPGRHNHVCLVYGNRVWILGGSDATGYRNDVWASLTETSEAIALYLTTSPLKIELPVSGTYELSSIRKTVFYNDNTTREVSTVTYTPVLGLLNGTVYTAPASTGTDTLEISYLESGKTITTHLIITVEPIHAASWTRATANLGGYPRSGCRSMVFNNKLWMTGGFDNGTYYNDVWSSDNGISWTQVTPNAGWAGRYGHSSVVFDNKMWVFGGYVAASPNYTNDVWYSVDGTNWIQATANAGWAIRYYQTSVVFDNKMWVMGGWGYGPTYYNDVWYSTDGISWTQASANAGWCARSNQTSVVFDNKMWVMGGVDSSNSNRMNDVWYSTDGISWIQASANAGWCARSSQTSVVFDDRMWVMGGVDSNNRMNDIWSSSDGANWVQVTADAGWADRNGHASMVFASKVWVICGYDGTTRYDDVWYSEISSSESTPLYLITSPLTMSVAAGGAYDCTNLHKYVFYSDNTSQEVSNVSYSANLGSFSAGTYSAPSDFTSDLIEITYTENSKTITSHVKVNKLQ
ncbi:MAG: hypothetical protein PHW04_12275 [Candidatus Wallbacteria bacterium]|nr:hypothetical protein [Candidatus Wallbacteria bacterium]